MDEEALEGGWQTTVTRRGDVVYRSSGPQSRTVLAFLAHLRDQGFEAAPRPIGSGFDPDGREQLAFIPGASPQPNPWSDEAVWQVGQLLRRLHEASLSFAPDAPTWRPWFARDLPGSTPVIGHGDLGPWNILAVDGAPMAFIDWDNAGPVDARWELAEAAWLNAQLHDDDVAASNGLGSADDRARQLGLILDGYGMARADRNGFVDQMIEFAVRSVREEAVRYQVGPTTVSPDPDGYPLLWAVAWRARSAVWMLDHRATLETAIFRRPV